MIDLSHYRMEPLHQDGEFILYRGRRQTKVETSPSSILALSPVMERTIPATIKKMEHEFSLKDELDPAYNNRAGPRFSSRIQTESHSIGFFDSQWS